MLKSQRELCTLTRCLATLTESAACWFSYNREQQENPCTCRLKTQRSQKQAETEDYRPTSYSPTSSHLLARMKNPIQNNSSKAFVFSFMRVINDLKEVLGTTVEKSRLPSCGNANGSKSQDKPKTKLTANSFPVALPVRFRTSWRRC